jgi:choice-of-anchor A domain-containing protein
LLGVQILRAASLIIASFATLVTVNATVAAPLSATDLLNSYNLIVFGDVTSTSEVDGKAYIGGNVTGGSYNQHAVNQGTGLPALTVGKDIKGSVQTKGKGLAVGGNLAAGSSFISNDGGNAYIKGNWAGSATFNMNGSGNVYLGGTKTGTGGVNGGALNPNQTGASFLANIPTAATTSAIQTTLTNYSTFLGSLAADSSVSKVSGTATFTATAGADGIAVFTIPNAVTFFTGLTQVTFNMNGAKELIINVLGGSGTTLNIAANFLGGSASARALDTVWNFENATAITIASQFGGSILAPLAAVTLKGNEEGTLVAASLNQSAEIHYDGSNNFLPPPPQDAPPPSPTPLPGSLPLFVSGLAAIGWAARRRRKKQIR